MEYIREDTMRDISKAKKIVIWSAGQNTKTFIEGLPQDVVKNVFAIVDNNRQLSKTEFCGITVSHPDSVDFSSVDLVVITSKTFRHEIRSQLDKIGFSGRIIDLQGEFIASSGLFSWMADNCKFVEKNGFAPIMFTGRDALVIANNDVRLCFSPDPTHNQLALELLEKGDYEQQHTNLILKNLKDGDCFFDIGANVGWYSLCTAKEVKNIRIHSFEPNSETFRLLLKNVRYNGAGQKITANCKALGETRGKVYFTKNLDTGNHIDGASGSDVVEVECTTIDAYVAEQGIQKIDFMKCDVEGAELLVLRGAEKTIVRHKPKILLEVFDSWTRRFSYSPSDIDSLLTKLGYIRHRLDDEAEPVIVNGNYLFIHKDDKTLVL